MKTWRVVVRIIGAVSGALITAILGGLRYLWDRWPLSMLEWIAVIAITLSILYGLAELVHFLFGLNRRTQTVNAWLGIHPTTIHYGTFREWVRHQSEHGFQHMVGRSLDDRMVTFLEWWCTSPPEELKKTIQKIVREELAKAKPGEERST